MEHRTQAIWQRFLKRIGPNLHNAKFDTWEVGNDGYTAERQRAVESAKKYLTGNSWHTGANLILYGQNGVGKDHLAEQATRVTR